MFICLYLGSDQGVEPLDRFSVRYEAVHPIHEEHDLTKSCKRGEGGDRGKRKEMGQVRENSY